MAGCLSAAVTCSGTCATARGKSYGGQWSRSRAISWLQGSIPCGPRPGSGAWSRPSSSTPARCVNLIWRSNNTIRRYAERSVGAAFAFQTSVVRNGWGDPMTHVSSGLWRWGATLLGVLAIATIMGEARAQQQSISAWPMNTEVNESGTADPVSPPAARNTAVLPWQPSTKPKTGKATDPNETQVTLVALLTQDGQRIESGLVWRVFKDNKDDGRPSEKDLVVTRREASPVLRLPPGDYYVNAAFGRAHLTRRITVKPGVQSVAPFVLNAGGLRVTALVEERK